MTLSFKYKRVKRLYNDDVKTPSIPVTLSSSGGKYDFVALLDSGADVSAMSKAVAELLGVPLNGEQEETSGIGGTVPAVQSTVYIEVGRAHEKYAFSLPVKVIMNDDDFPVLLGRSGFFDKFVIIFDQRNERVFLKASPA